MAITVVASTSATPTGTTVVLSVPTGVAAGDVLIAAMTVASGTATVTPPAGWAAVASVAQATNHRTETFSRVVDGSEPATYTWTLSVNVRSAGGMIAYRGVDQANPVNVTATTAASAGAVTSPAVTTTVDNTRLLAVLGSRQSTGQQSYAFEATFTEQWDVSWTTTIFMASGLADRNVTTASAIGPFTHTQAITSAWTGISIALVPVGGIVDAANVASDAASDATGYGVMDVTGAGSFDGAADVAGAGSVTAAGGADLSSASEMVGVGAAILAGLSAMTADSTMTGAGAVTFTASGANDATSDAAGAGQVLAGISWSATGESDMTGSGVTSLSLVGDNTADGDMAGAGVVAFELAGDHSGESDFAGFGERLISGGRGIASYGGRILSATRRGARILSNGKRGVR